MIILKISIFHEINAYFVNILRENGSETSWFMWHHNAPVYDVISKEICNWCKNVMQPMSYQKIHEIALCLYIKVALCDKKYIYIDQQTGQYMQSNMTCFLKRKHNTWQVILVIYCRPKFANWESLVVYS